MRTHRTLLLLPFLALAAFFAGCSNDHSDAPGFGTLNVRMTDDPGDFQQVNLVITDVSVRMQNVSPADTDSTTGWTTVSHATATYDLMTLRNGVFTTLGTVRLP